MTMLELAERCEAAQGADRELDAEVWRAISNAPPKGHWYKDFRGVQVTDHTIPEITVSLDAALTLVPDACDCRYFSDDPSGTSWKLAKFTRGVVLILGQAVTLGEPVLALVAAALRARHALSVHEG